jgi:hypothetical protein
MEYTRGIFDPPEAVFGSASMAQVLDCPLPVTAQIGEKEQDSFSNVHRDYRKEQCGQRLGL